MPVGLPGVPQPALAVSGPGNWLVTPHPDPLGVNDHPGAGGHPEGDGHPEGEGHRDRDGHRDGDGPSLETEPGSGPASSHGS
ncbi:MAG TPA: hypothetical protein VHY31_19945 [Streptosporangiaceae bacterium]|jgi:hypothetical protein|nr:hypothetical protein [Streptosporangiaceae bacterium]